MHHPSNALTGAVLLTPLPRRLWSVESELTLQHRWLPCTSLEKLSVLSHRQL